MIKLFKFLFKLIFYSILFSVLLVISYKIFNPLITPYQIFRIFEGAPGISKDWEDYENISPNFFKAVIAAEDARFFEHNGVDWVAVEVAKKRNARYPKKRRWGASTITMQTSKNTFLLHGRNYLRKGLEIYFTYLTEFIWGKKRILEVYANVVEFGDGVYGVEEASLRYFKKNAKNLSRREAALLASVLPNPRKWSPARPTRYINKRVGTIMARMNSVKLID